MKTYNTMSANPTLMTIINEKFNELLNNGRIHYNNLGDYGVKEVAKGQYIEDLDDEKFNALSLLRGLISLKNDMPANSLYDFPGLTINGQKMHLVIPVTKAFEVADKAKFLEEKLSEYGLKFPAQLYQLRKENRGQNLPGKDFPPPVPKTMDKSDAEYEKYLEEFYKAHGVSKVSDGLAFRKPYDHEEIDYGQANEKKSGYTNEYYQDQLEKNAKGKGRTVSAPIGERLKVKFKSLVNPDLKFENDKVKTSLNWQKIKSNAIKIAAVGAGVVGAGILLNTNPVLLAMLGSAFGLGALARYVRNKRLEKKVIRQIEQEEAQKKKWEENRRKAEEAKAKEKEKEAGKGEGKKPEPSARPQPSPQPQPTQQPQPSQQPNPTQKPQTNNDDDDYVYDVEGLTIAEGELNLDNAEFIRINQELNVVQARILELSNQPETEETKAELHQLKVEQVKLMKDRLEVATRLVERQRIMLDDLDRSARKR